MKRKEIETLKAGQFIYDCCGKHQKIIDADFDYQPKFSFAFHTIFRFLPSFIFKKIWWVYREFCYFFWLIEVRDAILTLEDGRNCSARHCCSKE